MCSERRNTARLLTLTVVVLAVSLAGCGNSEGPAQTDVASDHSPADSGAGHIHGLGINPRDGSLFIATHAGLFRAPRGEIKATRVGAGTQDTMGFTVIGPDRFLGSGHPGQGQSGPPALGLIESTDAGQSWRSLSLLGEADFHVLRSRGSRV